MALSALKVPFSMGPGMPQHGQVRKGNQRIPKFGINFAHKSKEVKTRSSKATSHIIVELLTK